MAGENFLIIFLKIHSIISLTFFQNELHPAVWLEKNYTICHEWANFAPLWFFGRVSPSILEIGRMWKGTFLLLSTSSIRTLAENLKILGHIYFFNSRYATLVPIFAHLWQLTVKMLLKFFRKLLHMFLKHFPENILRLLHSFASFPLELLHNFFEILLVHPRVHDQKLFLQNPRNEINDVPSPPLLI